MGSHLSIWRETFKRSALCGARAGIKTWWWISKITVITTLLIVSMQWAGVVGYLSEWLAPSFSLLGLDGKSVIVFVTNALSPLYSGIAVITTLNIDYRSAMILAVMGLICHNLIVETIIQRKSGVEGWKMVVVRISMALVAGVAMNHLLPADYSGTLIVGQTATTNGTLLGELGQWAANMAWLIPIMFVLIVTLNILQQTLRDFEVLDILSRPFAPLMTLLGLSRKSTFLWIVLNSLGLAYGGAVMIADKESGALSQRDLRLLNTHVAVSHSLVEDTLIFAAMGLSIFWLILPRITLSIICVWTQRLYYHLNKP